MGEHSQPPRDDLAREQMTAMAQVLEKILNGEDGIGTRRIGFALMVFPFGKQDVGHLNYISNGVDRRDMIRLMKEMVRRLEKEQGASG